MRRPGGRRASFQGEVVSMDINEAVAALCGEPGAVLADVRTPEEYAGGHIPGSVNWPLERLPVTDIDAEGVIYTYCHSGARSARAAAWLQSAGRDAVSIGGILQWTGPLEK